MRYRTSQLSTALRSKQIDGLVRQLVESSLARARRRISSEAVRMSAGELRGYVGARAHICVRDQLQRIAEPHQFDAAVTAQLVERALERTVNLLLRELTDQTPLILPMYEAPLRAAA